MKVAFQMDPWENLNFKTDSTVALIYEACQRGFDVFSFDPKDVFYEQGHIYAWGCSIELPNNFYSIDSTVSNIHFKEHLKLDLASFDVLFIRQEPPVDMAYQTSLYLLQQLPNKVVCINHPKGLLLFPEKLIPLKWPQLMPKTVILKDQEQAFEIIQQWGEVVFKPLFSKGGDSVYYIKRGDPNIRVIIQYFLHSYKEQWIVQEYLPKIKQGDIRILVAGGKVLSAFKRIPKKDSILSNMAGAGATPEPVTLNQQHDAILDQIIPYTLEQGLFFLGLDIIDNRLIEVNVTCPTGLKTADQLYSMDTASKFWDICLDYYALRDK